MNPWYILDSTGTETFFHPIFQFQSIYSPDRRARVFRPYISQEPFIPQKQHEESVCVFCLGRVKESTPEKLRVVKTDTGIQFLSFPDFSADPDQEVLFRRQGNLFEIISFHYWYKKYNINSSPEELQLIKEAFNDAERRESLEDLLRIKHVRMQEDSYQKVIYPELVKPFYSGFHELLTSGYHYCSHHQDGRLFSGHSMSYEEHRISYQMILSAMKDMRSRNPYIKYITVFQNWLFNAGASFKHWHKQILATDFWGTPLLTEQGLYQKQHDFYERFINETVKSLHLFIAENTHAVAYVEIGAKTGMITICSKSTNYTPETHNKEEWDSMSDLVHAILGCLESDTPYNEQWFYTPFDAKDFRTPWRIIINLRSNVPAGFENITQININPISPQELAYMIREKLSLQKDIAPDIIISASDSDIKLNYY